MTDRNSKVFQRVRDSFESSCRANGLTGADRLAALTFLQGNLPQAMGLLVSTRFGAAEVDFVQEEVEAAIAMLVQDEQATSKS